MKSIEEIILSEGQNLYHPDEPCAEEKLAAYIAGRSQNLAREKEYREALEDLRDDLKEQQKVINAQTDLITRLEEENKTFRGMSLHEFEQLKAHQLNPNNF